MGDSNWIKLNRSIWDCFLWDFEKPKYGLCWIDMLLMANYKDKKIVFDGKPMMISRGTFITSMVKLATRWDMDRATVKRFLNMLQDDGMITYTYNNRCTIVNIVKYEVYQNFTSDDATAESTAERQLEEVYQSRLPYLNQKDCCEELHIMCMSCDKFCGIKNHDYTECRELQCFKNWLGLEYLDWVNGY